MKILILQCGLIVSVLLFGSCKKENNHTPVAEAEVLKEIAYGTDTKQKMDVYLPANRNDETPVIVLLHGGGFAFGDKTAFSEQSQSFSEQGFIVLNINYRLVDADGVMSNPIVHKPSVVKIAEQLKDIDEAVKHAYSMSEEWKMSTSEWCIAGHSAGATLALLYGYGDFNKSRLIKAAANWAGATNFAFNDESEAHLLDPRIVEILYRAVGAEIKNENKLAYMAVSPLWLVLSGKSISTINIRPESNNVADLPDGSKKEYETFTNSLNSKNIVNSMVEIPGADHGFSKPGNWNQVINKTSGFFKSQLQ
jgi:acetyl esterase/lipase